MIMSPGPAHEKESCLLVCVCGCRHHDSYVATRFRDRITPPLPPPAAILGESYTAHRRSRAGRLRTLDVVKSFRVVPMARPIGVSLVVEWYVHMFNHLRYRLRRPATVDLPVQRKPTCALIRGIGICILACCEVVCIAPLQQRVL